MGVETDLILDNGRPYDLILASYQPSKDFAGVYAKGLDHFNLLSLAAILADEQPPAFDDPDDAMFGFEMVASTDDYGVAVWRLPPETSTRLQSVVDHDISDVAARWAATPYFELMDWDEDMTLEFLNDFCEMLRQPGAMDLGILMWVST